MMIIAIETVIFSFCIELYSAPIQIKSIGIVNPVLFVNFFRVFCSQCRALKKQFFSQQRFCEATSKQNQFSLNFIYLTPNLFKRIIHKDLVSSNFHFKGLSLLSSVYTLPGNEKSLCRISLSVMIYFQLIEYYFDG